MNKKVKRDSGTLAEDIAEKYLKKKGFRIIKKNYYNPYGEIDIIAFKKSKYYFIEVKYRSNSKYGKSIESIKETKIKRIKKGAYFYLRCNKIRSENISILFLMFDNVCGIIHLSKLIYDG